MNIFFLFAAAHGLAEGVTDPGAVEGEIGMTPGIEEGETTQGIGAEGIAATPGITGRLSVKFYQPVILLFSIFQETPPQLRQIR